VSWYHHREGAARISVYEADDIFCDSGLVRLLKKTTYIGKEPGSEVAEYVATVGLIALGPGQSVSLMDEHDVKVMLERRGLPHAHL
jgi:hypothetical protein